MQSLRLAVQSSAVDVEDTSADDLLAEIAGAQADEITDAHTDTHAQAGEGLENAPEADPPGGQGPDWSDTPPTPLHSIPHPQSPQNSEPTPYLNGSPNTPEGGANSL